MKKVQFLMLALVAVFFVSCSETTTENSGETTTPEKEVAAAPAAKYTINAEGATVMWLGTKAEGAHAGTFALESGSVMASANGIESGKAVIDLTAMEVTDDMPEEMIQKLAGHLGSADFFDLEKFPQAKLEITGSKPYAGSGEVQPEGLPEDMEGYFVPDPTHTIMGKLTVKGETNDITFPAKISMDGDNMDGDAFVTFDRRKYGLRFMSDTENTVNPDIHVAISFAASK